MTSTYKNKHKHLTIWKPFREYLFDNLKDKDLIYILVGKDTWCFDKEIESKHIYKITNPSHLKYISSKWIDSDIFTKINNELKMKNKTTILW